MEVGIGAEEAKAEENETELTDKGLLRIMQRRVAESQQSQGEGETESDAHAEGAAAPPRPPRLRIFPSRGVRMEAAES